MKHLRIFQTLEEIQMALDNNTLYKPYLALYGESRSIDVNTKTPASINPSINYSNMPLTIEITRGGNDLIIYKSAFESATMYYKVNDENTWHEISETSVTLTNLAVGDKIQLKGLNNTYGMQNSGSGSGSGEHRYTEGLIYQYADDGSNDLIRYIVYGNIMSIVYDDNFIGQTEFPFSNFMFKSLFYECTGLIDVSNLILPVMILTEYCYSNMFIRCNLTVAPNLPATTLARWCYDSMFLQCESLITPPELPATTLADYCYQSMFSSCRNLINAPELPAATLVEGCYKSMFDSCWNMLYIKCLATDISATDCTTEWVRNLWDPGYLETADNMNAWTIGENGIPSTWVSSNNIISYNPTQTFTPAGYVTFTIHENNTIFGLAKKGSNQTIYISKNASNWMSLNAKEIISVNNGDTIYVCGNLIGNNNYQNNDYTQFIINGDAILSGNCNYIWDKDTGSNTLKKQCGFNLFSNCIKLNINNFTLPSIILSEYCYYGMFSNCFSLTTTPILPATTLADSCYSCMFDGCKSLIVSPELPATTLYIRCYSAMFRGCTNLTTTPALPATRLTDYCYSGMFAECISLTTTPLLQATNLAKCCYYHMFKGCSSLTTITDLPATVLYETCYEEMFMDCISLITASIISATTLASGCCRRMFKGCINLTTAPVLSATTLEKSCYYYMFDGCRSLNYIKCLATDISASYCTEYWVDDVASTGTFVKNSSMTNWETGNSGIPSGWTVQNAA